MISKPVGVDESSGDVKGRAFGLTYSLEATRQPILHCTHAAVATIRQDSRITSDR